MTTLNDTLILNKSFSVSGTHLVEASAGTGKTYCIQTFFLRLVLAEGIPVKNVLVVTFTEAATKELKARLRTILEKARTYLNDPESIQGADRNRIEKAVELAGQNGCDTKKIRIRVNMALLDFDEAGIFTIHGFCNRVLSRYAFECGTRFDVKPASDPSGYIDELCLDMWRKKTRKETLACAMMKGGYNAFRKLAGKCIQKRHARIVPAGTEAGDTEKKLKEECLKIAEKWTADGAQITADLQKALREGYLSPDIANSLPDEFGAVVRDFQPGEDSSCVRFLRLTDRFTAKAMKPAQRKEKCKPSGKVEAFARICKKAQDQLKNAGIGVTKGEWRCPQGQDEVRHNWEKLLGELKIAYTEAKTDLKGLPDWVFEGAGRKTEKLSSLDDMASDLNTLKTVFTRFSKDDYAGRTVRWTPDAKTEALMSACDALAKRQTEYSVMLRGQWAEEMRRQYAVIKEEQRFMSFDDILHDLRDALTAGDSGKALCRSLRDEYKAALIDEFQDTDPVQYGIFKTIFMDGGNSPVFLVGDPKQAIYSFRSADIFTYYDAAGMPGLQKHSLDMNHRSEKNLIEGVNTVFKDCPGTPTFIHDKIPYAGHLTAKGKDKDQRLLQNGAEDATPFRIWFYNDAGKSGATVGSDRSEFLLHIYEATAGEICSILQNKELAIGERGVRCSDIAVLVKTHKEARGIHKALSRRNISSVLQSTGNVFDSDTAEDMYLLMTAIADAGNVRSVLPALTTSFFNLSSADIMDLQEGRRIEAPDGYGRLDAMEKIVEQFRAAFEKWRKSSFIEAFNSISRACGFMENMLKDRNDAREGERNITNMLHLAELTHKASLEGCLNMSSTLKWFSGQLHEENRENSDVHEIRLERDSNAVRIMTVFKSKGLQFPIVFVPTMWRTRQHSRDNIAEYHREKPGGTGQELVMDLSPEEAGNSLATAEKKQEEVRNLYVAATRAINRTYLVWYNISEEDENGKSNNQEPDKGLSTGNADVPGRGKPKASKKGNKKDGGPKLDKNHSAATAHVLDLGHLKARTRVATYIQDNALNEDQIKTGFDITDPAIRGVVIAVTTIQDLPKTTYSGEDSDYSTGDLTEPFKPDVDKDHGHTSFSGIAPPHRTKKRPDQEGPGRDVDSIDNDSKSFDQEAPGELTIFTFPAGAKTGDCWHSLFEELDFKADAKIIRTLVAEKLDAFRMTRGQDPEGDGKKVGIVEAMVQRVLSAPLGPGLNLNKIDWKDRISEMQFDFALNDARGETRTTEISDRIRQFWAKDPDKGLFLDRIGNWDQKVPKGFMTGSIDLVFRHDGKFYIADWKSNKLSGNQAGFGKEGLKEEMAGNAYFLQYLIYSVALDKYLRGSLRDYDYKKHFGGVFYIFLRGVTEDGKHGLYFDRPDEPLIKDLGEILGIGS